jgi:hypothetical protein
VSDNLTVTDLDFKATLSNGDFVSLKTVYPDQSGSKEIKAYRLTYNTKLTAEPSRAVPGNVSSLSHYNHSEQELSYFPEARQDEAIASFNLCMLYGKEAVLKLHVYSLLECFSA